MNVASKIDNDAETRTNNSVPIAHKIGHADRVSISILMPLVPFPSDLYTAESVALGLVFMQIY